MRQNMHEGFRQSQAWLHSWAGLVISWLLYLIFVTGTLSVFRGEIDYWMQPELHAIGKVRQDQKIDTLETVFNSFNTDNQKIAFASISLGASYQPTISVRKFVDGKRQHETYDPRTERKINLSRTVGGNFFYRMHYQLWYLSPWTGRVIVALITAMMLVTIITGIITHKKILTDFFVFRPYKGLRSWLDGHIISGVIILPFLVMIAFSGLVILIGFFMPWGAKAVYGNQQGNLYQQAFNFPNFNESASDIKQNMPSANHLIEQFHSLYPHKKISAITLYNPSRENTKIVVSAEDENSVNAVGVVFNSQGDVVSEIGATNTAAAIQESLNSLHRAHYANYALRWLYFLAGLAGCFMIASGLILWSKKRIVKNKKQTTPMQRIVQTLNITCIAGLCVAVPSLLIINKLIAGKVSQQPAWEVAGFFIVWALTFFYSIIRLSSKAWYEIFFMAALMCVGIFIVNLFYPYSNMFYAAMHDDWILASVDMLAIAFSFIFFFIGYKIRSSYKKIV
ncbi:PepSY domain-containing protein [Entomomonas moraniae]|uniref:PepSY domain-containing protein n=2 Tax=Entomomonas moraniae TaxID=2213226 RepID=A0A3Q9JJK5_9GAMM|nr:PepSY domain-containing protein [Entomomonas moraniae]